MAAAPEHVLSKRTVTGAYTDYDLSLAMDAASGKGQGNLYTPDKSRLQFYET